MSRKQQETPQKDIKKKFLNCTRSKCKYLPVGVICHNYSYLKGVGRENIGTWQCLSLADPTKKGDYDQFVI